MKKIDDFDTQIQFDELAAVAGQPGSDWINDFEDIEDDDDIIDD